MKDKPVAWINKSDLEKLPNYDCWVNGEQGKGEIPLYTHPQKELSDEETFEIAKKCAYGNYEMRIDVIKFRDEIIKASRGEE